MVQPFEKEFGKEGRFIVYETPMIKSYGRFSPDIDSGMKGGIIGKHDNVVTFYGDYSAIRKPRDEDYKFRLCISAGGNGLKRLEGDGYSKPEVERELFEAAKVLVLQLI